MLNMVDATATRSPTIAACPRSALVVRPWILFRRCSRWIARSESCWFRFCSLASASSSGVRSFRPTWEPKRARPARSWSAASALLRSSRLACTHACATCSKLPAMSEVGSSQRVWVIAAHWSSSACSQSVGMHYSWYQRRRPWRSLPRRWSSAGSLCPSL